MRCDKEDKPVVEKFLTDNKYTFTVLMDDKYMKRAKLLGQNVAKALDLPVGKAKYAGEAPENTCPACHADVLQIWNALPEVICPVCLLHGTLKSDGGKVKVDWDKNWPENYRFSEKSMLDHFEFIGRLAKKYHTEDEPTSRERIKKYVTWGKVVRPPAGE